MQKNNSPSLFDSKTLMAMATVGLVYFGWQSYLSKKYPGYGSSKPIAVPTQTATPAPGNAPGSVQTNAPGTPGTVAAGTAANSATPEVLFPFKNEKIAFSARIIDKGLLKLKLSDSPGNEMLFKKIKEIPDEISRYVN